MSLSKPLVCIEIDAFERRRGKIQNCLDDALDKLVQGYDVEIQYLHDRSNRIPRDRERALRKQMQLAKIDEMIAVFKGPEGVPGLRAMLGFRSDQPVTWADMESHAFKVVAAERKGFGL